MKALFQRIFGHKDTDVFSHKEHKGRKDGKGCEMSERNESFEMFDGCERIGGLAAGTRGKWVKSARGAHTEAQRHREGRKERVGRMGQLGLAGQLGRWVAVAAVAAGAWLESARKAGAVAGMARREAIG